jgi:hypothetical protein
MKTKIALGVGVIVGGIAWGSTAFAQVQFPTAARTFSVWLARAMDSCTPGMLTVVTMESLPTAAGCLGAHSATDGLLTMTFGKLVVRPRSGKVVVLAHGLPVGARVKIQLTVRVTKNGLQIKHPPGFNQRVTFADQTVLCGDTPFGFVVNGRGTLAGQIQLSTCLAPYPTLATGNIEILDAALVNADNSDKPFARPGILR